MEAKECKIQDILTENKKYIIPTYQRPYSWGKDNTEQLINDIYQSYYLNEKEYFIGSMICIRRTESQNTFDVVDGQQRLTTLSLILSQLRKLIKNQDIKNDLQNRLLPKDIYSEEVDEPRLTIRSKEYQLYKYYILQGDEDYKPEKTTGTQDLFIENSKVIFDYLKEKEEDDLKNLTKYILQNIFIVFVQTDNFESSFRLFNVLNNRGLPLSNSDLLKNSLFEVINNDKRKTEQIEKTWSDIEDIIEVRNLDKFLLIHKISVKEDRNRVTSAGFDGYLGSLKDDYNNDAIEMSIVLLNSARNYDRIISNDFDDLKTKKIIFSLMQLPNDEWVPSILAFLNRRTRKKEFNWDDFHKFIETFEKVYMHGWIKKLGKSKREMVCYSVLVAINKSLSFDEIISHILPHSDNDGLRIALNNDLYEPRSTRLLKMMLFRIDLEQQDESDIKVYTGRITIEHILPQKMASEYWISRFSNGRHSEIIHKLGNLTLISGIKNSEAQNSDFNKKKIVYSKPNNRSSFDITKDLCNLTEWDENAFLARHKEMVGTLERIWML